MVLAFIKKFANSNFNYFHILLRQLKWYDLLLVDEV